MSVNNIFIYNTTQDSADESEEQNKIAFRKKSISIETEFKNKINIKLNHRKSNSFNFRKDGYGNIISKESRSYKVSFRDGISLKPLAEVIPFEKLVNKKIEAPVGKVEMTRCECKCLIF